MIMKNINYFIIILALLAGCSDQFEDINKNPNNPEKIDPDFLFISSVVKTLQVIGSDNNWWMYANYTHQLSMIGGSEPAYGSGRQNDYWNNFYIRCLLPLYEIERDYSESTGHKNRVAIAHIWNSYIVSEMAAIWGPIPYSKACSGLLSIPYDKEEDIYIDLLKVLKENIEMLESNQYIDYYPEAAEPLFKSDRQKWIRFGHSLRLRIASRLIDNTPAELSQLALNALQEELSNESKLISSNVENVFMAFDKTEGNRNPYYENFIRVTQTNDAIIPVAAENFIMLTQPYGDPRLDKIFKKGTGQKTHLGRPKTMAAPQGIYVPNNPYSGLRANKFSQMESTFTAMTANYMIMSYPEICFIKAEAAYKGWINGSAEELYYKGITASCERFGVSGKAVDTYKEVSGIKWNSETDTISVPESADQYYDWLKISSSYLHEDDNYQRIVLQHWISLFYQGIDAWTLLRRTQILEFPPHFAFDRTTSGVADGNWCYAPLRLPYCTADANINVEETNKAKEWLGFPLDREDHGQRGLVFTKRFQGIEGYPQPVIY
jgi:hypothetical protein